MSKPIFIIEFPFFPKDESGCDLIRYRFEKDNPELYKDYHVIITFFADHTDYKMKFKMFSDKEIEPIELEKLKELLNVKLIEG